MKPVLNCDGTNWESAMDVLGDAGSFGYYGYALTKKTSAAGI
jgi:hypothetical protein